MYRIIYPLKDTTIYDKYPELNSGIDQILELTKITAGNTYESSISADSTWDTTYNSRILIKFDITPFQTILQENNVNDFNCYLKLYCTEADSIPFEFTINAYPIAEDWKNGTGNYNDIPYVKNGASWKYRSGIVTSDTWSKSNSYFDTIEVGGGSWLTSSYSSQSFSDESPDICLNITNIFRGWLSSSYSNNGIILKFDDNSESDTSIMGSIKYYSKDTHTIHSPRLILNYSISGSEYTGSFSTASAINIDESFIHTKNLK